jgi:prevent-host-death family protein
MNTKTRKSTAVWQLQEAKAMLSDVVKAAAKEAQIITVRGEEKAVILSMEKYKKFTAPKESLVEILQSCPWPDELELPERVPEEMREIDL